METSLFLAKLIGPVIAIIGAAILFNPAQFRAVADEITGSPALVFVIGHIALPAGLATVLVHNVWVTGWPVLITMLGWLGVIGGAARILAPGRAAAAGQSIIARSAALRVAGCVWLLLGLVLSYFGYVSARAS